MRADVSALFLLDIATFQVLQIELKFTVKFFFFTEIYQKKVRNTIISLKEHKM